MQIQGDEFQTKALPSNFTFLSTRLRNGATFSSNQSNRATPCFLLNLWHLPVRKSLGNRLALPLTSLIPRWQRWLIKKRPTSRLLMVSRSTISPYALNHMILAECPVVFLINHLQLEEFAFFLRLLVSMRRQHSRVTDATKTNEATVEDDARSEVSILVFQKVLHMYTRHMGRVVYKVYIYIYTYIHIYALCFTCTYIYHT